MEGKVISNDSGELITPKQAELWLSSVYEGQRRVRQYHVNHLASEMKKGKFMPTAVIHFCMLNGKPHLVNGQHTLRAIVESQVPQKLTVVRVSVTSELELARMYMSYDIGIKRSLKDAIKALGLEEITGLSYDHISKLCSACTWIERGFHYRFIKTLENRKVLPFEDQINLAQPWFDEYKMVFNTISPCGSTIRNKIQKNSVLSVALITFRYRPQNAEDFWRQVAQDDGLRISDPRKTLHNYLLKYVDITRVSSGDKRQYIVHPDTFSRAVARAWNGFMSGEELKTIIIRDYSDDIHLAGIDDDNIRKYIGVIQ